MELKKSPVVFDKVEHRYYLGEKILRGITSTLVHRAFPHTYDGIPESVLAKAADRGTRVHEAIDAYETSSEFSDLPELVTYEDLKTKHGLTHVASEYLVSDEQTYASSIDLVFTDQEGGIVLADIKTTSEPKYENVALQLSIYKRFFEQQNPDLKVKKIVLVWLRGEKGEYRELQPWADEVLDTLFKADAEDMAFDIATTYGDLPVKFADAEDEIVRLETTIKELTEKSKAIKAGLYELMESKNVKSFTGAKVKLTRVLPTESESFDTKTFKAEHADLYAQYVKKTPKSGSLRITIL